MHLKRYGKREHVMSMHNSLNSSKSFWDLAYLGIFFYLNDSFHLGGSACLFFVFYSWTYLFGDLNSMHT